MNFHEPFFDKNAIFYLLSHDDLLRLDIVAVSELEHIDARSEFGIRNAECGMNFTADDDTAHHVDDLECALTVDDDVAVAHEGEVAVVAGVAGVASGED